MDYHVNTVSTKPSSNGGAPKRNHNAVKHGLYAFKRVLDGDSIDRRSSLYKTLRVKELELINALGGGPSPQERIIITDCVKSLLYVGTCDNYLLSLRSLIRKSKPHPVLAIRTQLASHLRENLKTLGLKRVPKELDIARRYQLMQDTKGSNTK